MRNNLSVRIMVPTVATVVLAIAVFGWSLDVTLEREVRARAQREVDEQATRVTEEMEAMDSMSADTVRTAIKLLMYEGGKIGKPSLDGVVSFSGESTPDLRLGGRSQVGDFTLVDLVKTMTGATATLLARRNNRFYPVSSNVPLPDGSRSLRSFEVDVHGEAEATLIQGRPYFGVYEVVAQPYMTANEPMVDVGGTVIGSWYVGYPLRGLAALERQVRRAKVLEHGLIAVVRANGEVLCKSEGVPDDEVLRRMHETDRSQWMVVTRRFEPWRYTVVAAYPEADVMKRMHRVREMIVACTLGTCGLVVFALYMLITHLVVRPLNLLVQRMENADLNTRLTAVRGDEIGVLGRAFDQFVTRVREALIEVASTSEAVVCASERISAGANHVAQSVSTQKSQVVKIGQVLQEMTTQVQEVSGSCVTTAARARTAAERAGSGGVLVQDSLTQMQLIARSVIAISDHVQVLGRRSDEIGRIVRVIEEIAGQTNLLALNAAIEAARAGEQGRGFAVVALEVRSLAERTSNATQEIAQMVESIQSETRVTIEQIETGTRAVASGAATAGHAGSSLLQIVDDAERVGQMVGQIAAATTQQVKATERVSWNVDEITRFATESADGAKRSAGACDELMSLAAQLQGLVGRFHLGEGGGAQPL